MSHATPARRPRKTSPTRTWLLPLAWALPLAPALGALPPVPVPPQNPITEPKRVLGKALFWDEQLSYNNMVSCGTCHNPAVAGTDPRLFRNPGVDTVFNTPDDVFGSPGIVRSAPSNDYLFDAVFALNRQVTGRAANANINAAFAPQLFWDGRASGQFVDPRTGQTAIPVGGALESQSVGPPVSSVEMAHDNIDWDTITDKLRRVRPLAVATNIPADVAQALAGGASYGDLFESAFGDDAVTPRRIAFALATYQRTLISDQAPFDLFRAGQQNAITPQQLQGFQQFQAHSCSACHNIANDLFTDFSFRNIGLRPVAEDAGRQNVTNNPADRGRFKVPSLRNVGLKATFMHNGMFQTLPDVIRFYARAPGAPQQFPDNRDPLMNAIVPLPPQQAALIQDFLQNALTDPRVAAQTFPFDRPSLFSGNFQRQSTILGGGVAGTGGTVPQPIVLEPAMLGNLEYRIGLTSARPGSTARLAISSQPPVNGVLTPERVFPDVTTTTTGPGVATQHWPLAFGQAVPDAPVFAQWIIDDPGAPSGRALSAVARIPVFCGSGGCPGPCDLIDLNADRGVTIDDLVLFLAAFDAGRPSADLDDDGDPSAGAPDHAVTIEDLLFFLQRFDAGC